MPCPPEYKQEMEMIMNAFGAYIRKQKNWDIAYSEKIGYIGIQIFKSGFENALWVGTPNRLMYFIIKQTIADVVFAPGNSQVNDDDSITEYGKAESRRRIMAILDTMENKDRYLPLLDKCIKEF